MKERPILFSGPLVKALLAGTKTQTRRLVKPALAEELTRDGWPNVSPLAIAYVAERCPYGVPGDKLWVKETWRTAASLDGKSPTQIATQCTQEAGYSKPWAPLVYEADGERRNWTGPEWGSPGKTRVSIHMPRWASRITLEVTSVRAERLQSISRDDALAEGVPTAEPGDPPEWPVRMFQGLWDEINGAKAPWSTNPWLWVVGFRRLP